MEFTTTTAYDPEALKAMARGLRKSIRSKRSKRSHIVGCIVSILGVTLLLSPSEWDIRTTVTATAVVVITAALIWEDAINGFIAWKRGVPGLQSAVTTFREDGYHSVTELGASDFSYEIIHRLVKVGGYLVFVLGPSHAQVYDIRTLQGGTEEAFFAFLSERTGLSLEKV